MDDMAVYHLSAQVIGRRAGRSATAAAAYRAGEAVHDRRTGETHDYTRRSGVVYSEIIAPDGTPKWVNDRVELWNQVELTEKRKDAQLCREIRLALPHELDHGQRVDLVRAFVQTELCAQGMIADIAIHDPDRHGDDRNHHAHILVTMRGIGADGFGKKVREWNETAVLETWRDRWAAHANEHLAAAGWHERIDHRSYADQGIDREPTVHMGPGCAALESKGTETAMGTHNRDVLERNAERERLQLQKQQFEREAAALEKAIAEKSQTVAETRAQEEMARKHEAERQEMKLKYHRELQGLQERRKEFLDNDAAEEKAYRRHMDYSRGRVPEEAIKRGFDTFNAARKDDRNESARKHQVDVKALYLDASKSATKLAERQQAERKLLEDREHLAKTNPAVARLNDLERKEFQHLRTHQKEKAREQESARQDRARAAREQLERRFSLEDQERRPKGFAVLVEKVRNTLDPERADRLMQARDQEKRVARSALERRLSEDRRKEIRDLARTNVDEKSRFRDATKERRQFAEREMQRLQELSRGTHERTGPDRSR